MTSFEQSNMFRNSLNVHLSSGFTKIVTGDERICTGRR
jgi:hypothetical protein